MNLILTTGSPDLVNLVITFLVIFVGIVVVAGLIWGVETYVIKSPLPNPVRLVIGLLLIVLILIWGLRLFVAGG